MLVLFRLDRIVGAVPVVDAHTAGSVLTVEMDFNGQTQSTDDFCVPSKSKRVEVETRTQLLWTAPSESISAGALNIALYQDWPQAREAHPIRACLGRCSVELPVAQLFADGHTEQKVVVPLETSSHPLVTSVDWCGARAIRARPHRAPCRL